MVEFCDGWMPLANRHDIAGWVARLKEAVAEADRDPDSVLIIANGANTDQLEALESAGVDEVICTLPPTRRRRDRPRLDMLAKDAGLG